MSLNETHVRHWRIAFVVMHNRARLQGRKAAATDKLLVDNPIDRYKIGTDTKGLETAPDGSITIVISRDRPTGENASNWLPAPDGLFSLFLRLYQPSHWPRVAGLEAKSLPKTATTLGSSPRAGFFGIMLY
jgi:hypothetical protein